MNDPAPHPPRSETCYRLGVIKLAVIGVGAWGINHVRASARLSERGGSEVAYLCDLSADARKKASRLAPRAQAVESPEAIIADPSVDAVVIATPAVTHARLAGAALAAGKHVFVEKPLALSSADAKSVVDAANAARKILMVGHLMLYHPAIDRLRRMIDDGELGTVYYLYAQRVNLGKLRTDENALWSLAPHDISIILSLLGVLPISVSARGGTYLQRGVEDVVFVSLRFASGLLA